jgi:hypothetical protein
MEPINKKSVTYSEFLKDHRIIKGVGVGDNIITNTRIDTIINKNNSKQYAGNFQILDNDYDEFLDLYYNEIILGKKEEKLTEIQLKTEKSPLLIDIDLRFDFTLQERIFTQTDIEQLLELYLDVFEQIHQFDPDDTIEIFVMTKPNINHVTKGDLKYVKDGIHIIIGIQCDHKCQQYIRKRIIDMILDNPPPFWSNTPTTNPINEVFDERISKGDCPWQLYGSGKKELKENSKNEVYTLSYLYKWEFDVETDTIKQTNIPIIDFDMRQNFKKLSARYDKHPPFYASDFYENEIEKLIPENKLIIHSMKNRNVRDDRDGDGDDNETDRDGATTTDNDDDIPAMANGKSYVIPINQIKSSAVLQLASVDELDKYIVEYFIDNQYFETDQTKEVKQRIEYALILPEKYWGNGSYELWIRVGWALYSINDALFAIWVKISSQWAGFVWPTDVYNLYQQWTTFQTGGLSMRSIIYWAKNDAYEKYMEIKQKYTNEYVDSILARFDSVSDDDFAKLAGMMNKEKFVCASPKIQCWYEFKDHRWYFTENGIMLSKFIINDIRSLFQEKTIKVTMKLDNLKKMGGNEETIEKTTKFLKLQIKNLNTIVKKLGSSADVNKIGKLSEIEFYNKDFINNLDNNRDLLSFNNGIIDLKEKIFRHGKPNDYISSSTNINYIPFNEIPEQHKIDINKFMNSLFPEPDLCRYMWEHLASSISGRIHSQTFNYYIGEGSNGKSVLTDLMSKILGDYYRGSVITLITE